jgi:hypothetical protein
MASPVVARSSFVVSRRLTVAPGHVCLAVWALVVHHSGGRLSRLAGRWPKRAGKRCTGQILQCGPDLQGPATVLQLIPKP